MLANFPVLQIKIEQIIAVAVSLASAGIAWYTTVNSKMSSMEAELKVKNNQVEYFEKRSDKLEKSLEKIVERQDLLTKDVNTILIILERKADRQ